MLFGALAGNPCLGNPCVAGVPIGAAGQTAGGILMIVIVFALAWYGNKKWKGESGTTAGMTPA